MTAEALGPKNCPSCGLLNDPTSHACECGYAFPAAQAPESARVVPVAEAYGTLIKIVGLQIVAGLAARALRPGRAAGDEGLAMLSVLASVLVLGLAVAAGVKGYRVAKGMELSEPGMWAFGLFVPCANIFVLGALSSRATKFCRDNGLRVGLLGPTFDTIQEFRTKNALR